MCQLQDVLACYVGCSHVNICPYCVCGVFEAICLLKLAITVCQSKVTLTCFVVVFLLRTLKGARMVSLLQVVWWNAIYPSCLLTRTADMLCHAYMFEELLGNLCGVDVAGSYLEVGMEKNGCQSHCIAPFHL